MPFFICSLFLLAKLFATIYANGEDVTNLFPGSSGETDGTKEYGNYKGKQKFTIDGVIPVTLHKSSKTGLSIVHADIKQTLVEGIICVATEAHDNDGLPHTLEHLIFMGSKKYPFKGALDMIASRCLASGTNAWTGRHETCYTMKTAGGDGFLNLMPIFLDHILNPILDDSFFVTEIHHVNGEGQDGGVAFNEMKNLESSPFYWIQDEALRLLYPGKCGNKWETGGSSHNLRTYTNNDKVQKYHSKFYRPENMLVLVAGNVDKKKLFDSLQTLEDEEGAKEREPFQRPFSEPCPPLLRVVENELEYPDEEEKFGRVSLNWRLTEDLRKDNYKYWALAYMKRYLSWGFSSPLQKSFVQTMPPLATSVFLRSDRDLLSMSLYFVNVPVDRLEEVKFAYFSLMQNVTNSEMDLERMRGILRTSLAQREADLEDDPADRLLGAIYSFVQVEDMENLESLLGGGKKRIEALLNEDESFWREAMKPFLKEDEIVVVVGRPSRKKMKQMEEEEKRFVENRIRRLGRDGLAEKAKLLKEAKEKNDARRIPDEVLTTIPIPDTNSISFPEVITVRSRRLHPDAASQLPENADEITNLFDVLHSPYAIQISHHRSSYVVVQAFIHTNELDDDLKRYFGLYHRLIFYTALKRGNVTISHEDVDSELRRETIANSCSLSYHTGILKIWVEVEKKKFLKGLQYVNEAITGQVFTQERLQHYITSFNNSFPSKMKRSSTVMNILMRPMYLTNNSYERLGLDLISQRELLTSIAGDVRDNEARETLEKFERITNFIRNPKRIMLHIAGDIKSIADALKKRRGQDLAAVLDEYFGAFRQAGDPPSTSVCLAYPTFSDFRLPAKPGSSRVKIVGMGTQKTASLSVVSLTAMSDDNSDLPTLRVISSYFNMDEGPLWKQIRGSGLAYGFSFRYSRSKGYASFHTNRASDVVRVYEEMKKFVDALSEENGRGIDALTLESAKTTLIYALIARFNKPVDVANYRMNGLFVGRSFDNTKVWIERITRVTKADVRRVLRERVQPIFDPKGNAQIVIAANPSKVDQIARDFRQMGIAVEEIDVNDIQ